jgi:hypothetical protein
MFGVATFDKYQSVQFDKVLDRNAAARGLCICENSSLGDFLSGSVHWLKNARGTVGIAIMYIQCFEFWSMIYIINYQKKKRVEEITYEHNHEKITQSIEKGETMTFRRKEKRFIHYGIIFIVIVIPLIYLVWPYVNYKLLKSVYKDEYYDSGWKKFPEYAGNISLLVIYSGTFVYVMHLMKKLHQYEF